jgi:hypothetical protein
MMNQETYSAASSTRIWFGRAVCVAGIVVAAWILTLPDAQDVRWIKWGFIVIALGILAITFKMSYQVVIRDGELIPADPFGPQSIMLDKIAEVFATRQPNTGQPALIVTTTAKQLALILVADDTTRTALMNRIAPVDAFEGQVQCPDVVQQLGGVTVCYVCQEYRRRATTPSQLPYSGKIGTFSLADQADSSSHQ